MSTPRPPATDEHPATLLVPVHELHVLCSYPTRPDVIAASDTCRRPAESAVASGDNRLYRCGVHRGLVRGTITGEVSEHVRRRWQDAGLLAQERAREDASRRPGR